MTLNRQLLRTFFVFNFSLTFIFCFMAVIGLFVMEDNTFFKELKRQEDKLIASKLLPSDGSEVTDDIVFYASIKKSPFYDLNISSSRSYETGLDGQHYHIRLLQKSDYCQPLLAFNVTERMLVSHSYHEVIIAFAVVFLTISFILYFVTLRLSKNLLGPFNQLVFAIQNRKHGELNDLAQRIKHEDVSTIYEAIFQSWQEKENSLAEQLTFNKGISHELRTPIQVIKQSVELLLRDANEENVGSQKNKLLLRLKKANSRMENICSAFLWLSSDKQWQEPTDVMLVFQETLELFSQEFEKRKIDVDLVNSKTCTLIMPKDAIQVVLNNLLVNAIQYAQTSHDKTTIIKVCLMEDAIVFSNALGTQNIVNGFGLGMKIVQQLLARFEYDIIIKTVADRYEAAINRSK